MAGVASAAVNYTLDEVWSADFGSGYTNGYELSGTLNNQGTFWDVSGHGNESGVTTASKHRPHLAGGVYGNWDEDFQFSITLTLGETISASNNWPVFATLSGNGTALRFGPYIANNNTVALDGNLTKGDDNNLVSVTAGGTYTITLTKIGTDVTLAVDGVTTGVGTLADTVTGNITDIALGGDTSTNYRINETVHSISMSKVTVIPEPTTATLSLLALAGLAARRRRK